MTDCGFGSPDLVTSLSGTAATPTFAFDAANSHHLELAGSFTYGNGHVCSFPTRLPGRRNVAPYAITPIIVTTSGGIGQATTCSIMAPQSVSPSAGGSTTYTRVECLAVTNNELDPGTYTLRFDQPGSGGAPDIGSRVFTVADPTYLTHVTKTVVQYSTAPVVPMATTTITEYTSTVTKTVPYSSTSTSKSSLLLSLDGYCGETSGQTCLGSVFGDCCSAWGYCGSTDVHCKKNEGCQPVYGGCIPPSVSASGSPIASPSKTPAIYTSKCSTPYYSNSTVASPSKVSNSTVAIPLKTPVVYSSKNTPVYSSSVKSPVTSTPASKSSKSSSANPVSISAQPSLPTSKVSTDGVCGGAEGLSCIGSGLGDCCSYWGFCGSSPTHCNAGCQKPFGTCQSTGPLSTLKTSMNGVCGGTKGQTCQGSAFGDCCSAWGFCGSSLTHCNAGCQTPFGTCQSVSSSNPTATGSTAVPHSTLKTSVNGACGGTTSQTCQGSAFGDCCSAWGFCGITTVHCGTGCQTPFGTCQSASSSKPTSAAASSATLKTSMNGVCGDTTGETCQGSNFGDCCSAWGFCGSTTAHCGAGCDSAFGICGVSQRRAPASKRHQPLAVMSSPHHTECGGAGPDYTYPPIPTKTFTSVITQLVTLTKKEGTKTATVFDVRTITKNVAPTKDAGFSDCGCDA
ncbi:hypothetical protein BDV95DRAFT_611261 [Massariosphaeria phaeospora]|uniref:Chitin-binding type-1 domain-containing protein n=1 Tax=Massariosphaeria phaeospora TaxID=100035 RepID=A0A7C8M420_9PLEO|nr:hypothetical protein BDV95DRAFT_611261 [Massariosphaeria phaeospora]